MTKYGVEFLLIDGALCEDTVDVDRDIENDDTFNFGINYYENCRLFLEDDSSRIHITLNGLKGEVHNMEWYAIWERAK